MRQFAFGIAVSVTLLGAEFASAQSTFNVLICPPNATDIVVTDTEGRVLESWRGEFKPGDTVRLGMSRRSPAEALPPNFLRLRPEFALSGLYRIIQTSWRGYYIPEENDTPMARISGLWPTGEEAEKPLRLVLFLRKKSVLGQAPFWWEPASIVEAPPEHTGGVSWYGPGPWPSEPGKNDFTDSITLVEAGRVMAFQPKYGRSRTSAELMPVAGSLKEFKDEVMRLPAFPHSQPEEKPQPKPIESLRTATYFGTFISDPPPTPAKVSICETSAPTRYVVLRKRLFRFRR